MKKILLLFSAVGMLSLTACSNDDDNYADGGTLAEVFEVANVNFPTNNVVNAVTVPLNPTIYTSDMVLVYRLAGTDNGNDVWEPLPTTYNFTDGTKLSYYFDFSIDKVVLYLESDFDAALEPGFSQNQVYRIMIVPGYRSDVRMSKQDMDYNTLVKKYGIKESDIKQISVK